MKLSQRLNGIYYDSRRKSLFTVNLKPGTTVYDERVFKDQGVEYRQWNPNKSKLAAAVLKGMNCDISAKDIVLYLGSSTGTTVSHVSDIVGKKGLVFAVEFAPRVMRDLIFVAEERKNIAPILASANHPEKYEDTLIEADLLYQDIAQKNQVEIFLKNFAFLKKGGYALLAVKARSVDVTKNPKVIFAQVKKELSSKVEIIDMKNLEPFHKDHMIFLCKKS